MTPQTLFKPPPAVPHPETWTPNQQTAWNLIRSTPGGVTADEIGALVHDHTDQEPRCIWCATTGLQIARSAALKPHVVKRRNGKIEPREARYRALLPSSQLADLPDWLDAA